MLQQQVIEEIKQIPNEKLTDVYNLIHYFRLGLLLEQQTPSANNALHSLHNANDSEYTSWLGLSSQTLERAYDEQEEDYSVTLIKEVNPDYERK